MASFQAKKKIETGFTIIDLTGGSTKLMSKGIYDLTQIASQICQDYYPETLGVMYIVNCSFILRAAWFIIKQFLDEKTANKIQILGGGFEPELLKYITKENLPKFLGGICECPNGCLIERPGPWSELLSKFPKENDKEDAIIPKFPDQWKGPI